jgi:hypothetical protein
MSNNSHLSMTETPDAPKRSPSRATPWLIALALTVVGVLGFVVLSGAGEPDPPPSNLNTNGATNAVVNAANSNAELNTNTEIDTTSWRTYSNTRFAYSLRYPNDWVSSSGASAEDSAFFSPTGDLSLQVSGTAVSYAKDLTVSEKIARFTQDFGHLPQFAVYNGEDGVAGVIFADRTLNRAGIPGGSIP